tara:strand:+ start:254 stop:736 length:483 start_codon:yes stop_codon:yes gene_type:complete
MQIKFKEYPHMKPIRMATKDKGFFGGIWLWIATTRKWEITQDWNFTLDSTKYVVPKGFIFDGASVPKYFRSYLSPMGVLLIGGLVHDYGYKYEVLLLAGGKKATSKKNQKWMDKTFRDINIDQNGFFIINQIAYFALRLGGWLAWRKHRKNNLNWKSSVS